MTTHLPLLLAALLATPVAPTQAVPGTVPASDLPRVKKIFAAPIAAYARLRSYSGRFSNADPLYNQSQTGTLQFERPNRLAMRVQIKDSTGAYTRRVVSDGKFLWTLDSRFKNRYTKEAVRPRPYFLGVMVGYAGGTGGWMDICWLLKGETPLDGAYALRVTSPSASPVLDVDLFTRLDPGETNEERKKPRKMSFRFGPSDHLLRTSVQYMKNLGFTDKDKAERHWDIRLNPTLPASTFRFKPAPGARQIRDFSYLYEDS